MPESSEDEPAKRGRGRPRSSRNVRVVPIYNDPIDTRKLARAFLELARYQIEQERLAAEPEAPPPEQVEPPKPELLAVVPSGLPIAEAIARLQELQHQFPTAMVKRGRAGRFELWSPSA